MYLMLNCKSFILFNIQYVMILVSDIKINHCKLYFTVFVKVSHREKKKKNDHIQVWLSIIFIKTYDV